MYYQGEALRMRGWLVSAAGLLVLAAAPLQAGQIDAREINALTNSLILNNELLYLELLQEQGEDTTVLSYGSAITNDGWTTSLSGTYFGQPVDVTYTGTHTPTSGYQATISYTSTGTWGAEDWTGSGTFDWEEYGKGWEVSGGLSSSGMGVQVGVAYNLGAVSVGVNVDKDYLNKKLKADAYAGFIDIPLLGRAWTTGGRFKLDQATGIDQCYIYTEVLWGLYKKERAVGDRTRLFRRVPPPPPPPADPPRVYPPDPPYPREDPPWDDPTIPPDSSPGTEGMSADETLYDYGYVAGYDSFPEPATLTLLILGASIFRRR